MQKLGFLFIFTLLATPIASAQVTVTRQAQLKNFLLQDCGSCHGMSLKGGLGKALLPDNLKDRKTSDLKMIILEGIPGTAMPPWKNLLKDEEADELVRLLKSGEALK